MEHELRSLVKEMYDWTRYKETKWAKRAKAALDGTVSAQHRMHLTAFGAFLAGGFVGGLLMLIVLVGLYGGR